MFDLTPLMVILSALSCDKWRFNLTLILDFGWNGLMKEPNTWVEEWFCLTHITKQQSEIDVQLQFSNLKYMYKCVCTRKIIYMYCRHEYTMNTGSVPLTHFLICFFSILCGYVVQSLTADWNIYHTEEQDRKLSLI